jgi:RNA polymerase sigma factor (sigma-70 family)
VQLSDSTIQRAVNILFEDYQRQGNTLDEYRILRLSIKLGIEDHYPKIVELLTEKGVQDIERISLSENGVQKDALSSIQSKNPRGGSFRHKNFELIAAVQVAAKGNAATLDLKMLNGSDIFDELIKRNSRLVHSQVVQLVGNYHEEYEDLYQEGCMGMAKAAIYFDLKRDNTFSTYATFWIRQYILRYLANNKSVIRIPVHMIENLKKFRKLRSLLESQLGKEPTITELSIHLQQPMEKIRFLIDLARWSFLSTQANVRSDTDLTWGDLLISNSNSSLNELISNELTSGLEKELDGLSGKQRDVIVRRMGMCGFPKMTLDEIGREFGLTRERIRQIEKKALGRLRHPTRARRIKRLID